jgi:hypothetical protein
MSRPGFQFEEVEWRHVLAQPDVIRANLSLSKSLNNFGAFNGLPWVPKRRFMPGRDTRKIVKE